MNNSINNLSNNIQNTFLGLNNILRNIALQPIYNATFPNNLSHNFISDNLIPNQNSNNRNNYPFNNNIDNRYNINYNTIDLNPNTNNRDNDNKKSGNPEGKNKHKNYNISFNSEGYIYYYINNNIKRTFDKIENNMYQNKFIENKIINILFISIKINI